MNSYSSPCFMVVRAVYSCGTWVSAHLGLPAHVFEERLSWSSNSKTRRTSDEARQSNAARQAWSFPVPQAEVLPLVPPTPKQLSLSVAAAGIPFRETHHISGAAVKLAEDKGCQLSDLTTQDLQGINKLFSDDVQEVWDFNRSVLGVLVPCAQSE